MATSDDATDDRGTPFDESEAATAPTVETEAVEVCHPTPPEVDHPLTFDSKWRTETVVAIARGIEFDTAYDRLPILADALEEAGCDHPQLLHHCRTSPHPFDSCWVVNVILGRSFSDALPQSRTVAVETPAAPTPTGQPVVESVTRTGLAVRVLVCIAFLWALTGFVGPLCHRFSTRDVTHFTAPGLAPETPKPTTQPALTAELQERIDPLQPARVVVDVAGDPGSNDAK